MSSKYEGIEKALNEKSRLIVYNSSGVNFLVITFPDKEELRINDYECKYPISSLLTQASDKILKIKKHNYNTQKKTSIDSWIQLGNGITAIKNSNEVRLDILTSDNIHLITIREKTFNKAYKIAAQTEFSPEFERYLDFIKLTNKIFKKSL